MDNALFIDVLNKTFYQELNYYIIGVLCVVYAFVGGMRRPSNPKSRKGREAMIALGIIGVICLLLLAPKRIIAYTHDISKEQFVQVQGTYTFSDSQASSKGISRGRVHVTSDETELTLNLPVDWSKQSFPNGKHTGTIWYSKESKIILKFIPRDSD
ncbi:MAG: hypothetical protein IIV80_06200 [Clostridia bacterium]|nr:hypothetical protein [Clostridia bacterium]